MPYARTLRRAINQDIVEQLDASGKVTRPQPAPKKHAPRPSATYRGARRNARRK